MKIGNFLVFIFVFFVSVSCFKAQSNKDRLPGTEVIPGASIIETSFFKPFKTEGKILEKKSDSKNSIFRLMKMKMNFAELNSKKTIYQELTYLDEKNKPTGIHKTYYDPKTFQVLYWEYKGFGNPIHFAFKANGTSISGTQNPSSEDAKWQTANIGIKLFQNETREIFFRSLNVEKGKSVKFPIIGAKPPFHGWVAYEYNRDEEIEFNGKKYTAKVWQTPNSKRGAYYKVISDPPYVIERGIIGNPKGGHTFKFEKVEF